MDARQFEQIKAKIETLKTKRAKAEGTLEAIVDSWKKTYKVDTIEEAEALLEKLEKEATESEEVVEALYSDLTGLTNWGLI